MQKVQLAWRHFWQYACSNADIPEVAREQILEAAFNEIHRVGFQAASIQNILKETNLTKGALYHHFPNKNALGYAIIDEVIRPLVEIHWIAPLQTIPNHQNPIDILIQTIADAGEKMTMDDVTTGCPLNNLSQEMSLIDEGFRKRTDLIYQDWRNSICSALEQGKQNGFVKQEINTEQFSIVFVATLEGCLGMAKSSQSLKLLLSCGSGLMSLLNGLRKEAK